MSTTYICTQCPGPIACTFSKPEDRDQFPIYCTPKERGKIRVPIWRQAPDYHGQFYYAGSF